jgi:MFS family permease
MTSCSSVPVARLWAAVLAGYLALGATLQELPGLLQSRFHAGTAEVAFLVGLAFAGTATGRPFAGGAGDSGHSRAVALCGAALTAAAGVVTVLAPDPETLAVARLLMGLGEAALFSATLPWVLSVADPSRSGRIAGWFGLSMWGGLSLGPLLAVAARSIAGTTGAWSVIIALPFAAAAILLTTAPPTSPTPRHEARRSQLAVAHGAVQQVGMPGVVLGLAAYGYGSLTALLVLYLSSTPGLGGQDVGLAVFSGAFLLTRAAGSSRVDRHGGRHVAQAVLIVQAAGLTVLAEARSPLIALTGAALTGVGLGLIYPATTKLTLHRTNRENAGAAVGAMTSMWDAGILAAGVLSGIVATGLGYRSAYLLAAALALLAFAFVSRARLPVRPGTANDIERICRKSRSKGAMT